MIDLILRVLYLMLPAYAANMVPVLVKKINFLNYPVDLGKKYKGQDIFGNHKTWRGLFFGVIAGVIVGYLQSLLYGYACLQSLSLFDYSAYWLSAGILLGTGALLGDLVKSFAKRRFKVKPGKSFMPWDQVDYTIGSLLFLSMIFVPSLKIVIGALVVNFLLHMIANHLAFYLKLSKVKW